MIRVSLLLFAVILAGCAISTPLPTTTTIPTHSPIPSEIPTHTVSPQPATATLPSPSPEPTITPALMICSLVNGIPVQDLPSLIVNPFAPPRLGSDDPHQGVDFADIDPTYQIALEGRRVNAVLNGLVAGVLNDRFPYGNAVLVETPLEQLPDEWLKSLQIPTPAPYQAGHPSLTCPESGFQPESISGSRSLYLIYAHFKEPAQLKPGDFVTCGTALGVIGNSGNSLNPHVHLESRVGPANVRFDSMAHYTGSASLDELANYCLWRVSEAFQLIDPMRLFSLAQ